MLFRESKTRRGRRLKAKIVSEATKELTPYVVNLMRDLGFEEKQFAEYDRLVAAAPDMLVALKAIHDSLSQGDHCPAIWQELAREAITKATGAEGGRDDDGI